MLQVHSYDLGNPATNPEDSHMVFMKDSFRFHWYDQYLLAGGWTSQAMTKSPVWTSTFTLWMSMVRFQAQTWPSHFPVVLFAVQNLDVQKKLSEIMATKKWQKDNETQETIMAWFWTLLTQGTSSPVSTRWAPVLHVTFREVVPGIRKMDETNWANTKWFHHCELNTSAEAGICRVLWYCSCCIDLNHSVGWFQPIWKIWSSNRIISPGIGVKIKNIWNHHLASISTSLAQTATREVWNRNICSPQQLQVGEPSFDWRPSVIQDNDVFNSCRKTLNWRWLSHYAFSSGNKFEEPQLHQLHTYGPAFLILVYPVKNIQYIKPHTHTPGNYYIQPIGIFSAGYCYSCTSWRVYQSVNFLKHHPHLRNLGAILRQSALTWR